MSKPEDISQESTPNQKIIEASQKVLSDVYDSGEYTYDEIDVASRVLSSLLTRLGLSDAEEDI